MLKSLLFTTFVVLLVSLISAQVAFQGPCSSDVSVVKKFNVKKYMGKWYEYAKYPTFYEAAGKCTTAEYSLRRDGSVTVINSMTNSKTNVHSFAVGNATVVENGKLLVKFPVSSNVTVASNYWVLDTDYKSYSVVYGCGPKQGNSSEVNVWILTREDFPAPCAIKKSIKALKKNQISLNELEVTNQISCNF